MKNTELANSINSDIIGCHLMSSNVIWCHLVSSDVIGCHLMSSVVIWCHLLSSVVICCHLLSSVVIWCQYCEILLFWNFLVNYLMSELMSFGSCRGVFTPKNTKMRQKLAIFCRTINFQGTSKFNRESEQPLQGANLYCDGHRIWI